MTNKTWLAVGAGLTLVAAGAVVAYASDWGGYGWHAKHPRGHDGGGRMATSLLHFDTDKDGAITRAEIDAGIQAEFKNADANDDGHLDAAEFQKFNDARRAERKARYEAWRAKREAEGADTRRGFSDRGPRSFDPMRHMDWNLDGTITPDEFGGRMRALAMRTDRNGDGIVQPSEMKKHSRSPGGGEAPETKRQ